MRFNSFRLYRIASLFIATILLVSCSPSVAQKMDSDPGGDETVLGICSEAPENIWFDLQAASVMQALIGDDQLEELGMDGAEALADDLYSREDTFCGLDTHEQLKTALDEIQALYDAGEDLQAEELLDSLLISIAQEEYTDALIWKLASPSKQAGGASTRRVVRNYLDVAGRASYLGNDDIADRAFLAATDTYEKWAEKAVDTASIHEALRIAAEAQLFGLDDLSDQALNRASDLADQNYQGELKRFQPCSATREDAGRLLDSAAKALILGIEVDTYETMAEIEEWLDIQKRRKEGEQIPECDLWQVELELDEVWDAGYHRIVWKGDFKVLEDGTLEGEGQGSVVTHVEIDCVNVLSGEVTLSTTDVEGTFTFQIIGQHDQSTDVGEFKFIFPAEVSVTGVDTCNDFDEAAYLPAYVIEEIHVNGGVENYDLEKDTIYMVLPAVDGASQVYETLIGPVIVKIHYLGSGGNGSD